MENLEYKIIYTKRRSIALTVNKNAEVVVRASRRYGQNLIAEFVSKNRGWIEKTLLRRKQQAALKKQFVEGEVFLFLGGQYPLRFTQVKRPAVYLDQFLTLSLAVNPKPALLKWYKQQAAQVLQQRCRHFGQQMKVTPRQVNITSAGSRWGSCSSSGSVNFSYRLVMAPVEIIDYVVVHELAHIVHKNHSQKFWQLVLKYYPKAKAARAWLNKNGHMLVL